MKKTIITVTAVLMILVMLTSCGNSTDGSADVQEIYGKITESVTMPEVSVELDADDLADYYGIEADKVAEYAAVQDALGYKTEIVIIRAADAASAEEIEVLFGDYIEYQKNCMRNYDPLQYEILGSSEVIRNGVYVAMFISSEQSTMAEIFSGFFR